MRSNNDRHEAMVAAHNILERRKIALCNPACGIGRDYKEAAGPLRVEYIIAKDIEKAMAKVRDWITCSDCDEPQGQCECYDGING